MNKEEARIKMNQMGKKREAFFFLSDFELENIKLWPSDKIPDELKYDFGSLTSESNPELYETGNCIKSVLPFPKKLYKKAFMEVQNEIHYGNTFLINLTARSEIALNCPLLDIYYKSKAKYKLYYENRFVCFSPECFVKIKNGKITSYPMKGTIDAKVPGAEEIIMGNVKEKAEHNTIVDLIRNDVSRFAKNVHVPKFRYIQEIHSHNKSLLQVSSEICGTLDKNYHESLGDILISMLPAGSVSGAPKDKTLEIIQRVEGLKRKYYTGVAGYFDGYNLDSCVLIRFIELDQDKYYYRSGGGITFMSELNEEYDELIQKIYVPTH